MTTYLLPAQLLQTIPQGADYIRILPELILSVFGIVVMVLDRWSMKKRARSCLVTSGSAARLPGFWPPGLWRSTRVSPFRTW